MYGRAWAGMLNGVSDQIRKDLRQPFLIHHNRRESFRHSVDDLNLLSFSQWFTDSDPADNSVVNRACAEFLTVRFTVIKEVSHQPVEMTQFFSKHDEELLALRRAAETRLESVKYR